MEKFSVSEVVADGEVVPVPGEPLWENQAQDGVEALRLFLGAYFPIRSWDVDNMVVSVTVPRSAFRGRSSFYSRFRGRENVDLEVVGEFDNIWEAELVGEVEAYRSRFGTGESADKMVLVVDENGNKHPTNIFTGDDVHGSENKYGLDRRDSEVLYRDFLADFCQKLDEGLLALYKRTGDRFPTLDYLLPDFYDVLEQYVDGS